MHQELRSGYTLENLLSLKLKMSVWLIRSEQTNALAPLNQKCTMKRLKEVLLVDDSQATNVLNKRLLLAMGIVDTVTIALNGKEALDYLTTPNVNGAFPEPEIIFLDINMPVMDGFEFLEHYNDIEESIKAQFVVVMLTTSVSSIDKDRVKKFKIVTDFLEKPLTKEVVLQLLKQLY